jgi:hypothetical protein
LNSILSLSLSYNLALDFQKVIALLATHHILDININQMNKNKTKAIIVGIISDQNSSELLSFTVTIVLLLGFFNHNSSRESFFGSITISLLVFVIDQALVSHHLIVAIALFQSINISLYLEFEYFSSN